MLLGIRLFIIYTCIVTLCSLQLEEVSYAISQMSTRTNIFRFRYLSHRRTAKSSPSLLSQSMDVVKGSGEIVVVLNTIDDHGGTNTKKYST